MVIIELGYYSITVPHNLYGDGLNPHMGLIFASGLLLGPYGAIGAALGDITCNIIKGSPLPVPLISGFISFAVSYLSYKLWYSKFYKEEINPPILINSFSLIKFLGILQNQSYYLIQFQEHILITNTFSVISISDFYIV